MNARSVRSRPFPALTQATGTAGGRSIPAEMQPMVGATQVASFKATTSVDRNDYEVGVGSWAGTMVVGDAVEIEILAEAHRR